MRVIALISAFLVLGLNLAFAATESDCAARWSRADSNKDGALSRSEGAEFYTSAQRDAGNVMTADQFMQACQQGTFETGRSASRDSDASIPGANSFTEAQARERVMTRGFSEVGRLQKDASGVWRGEGKRDGKTFKVSIDYKGNVVVE